MAKLLNHSKRQKHGLKKEAVRKNVRRLDERKRAIRKKVRRRSTDERKCAVRKESNEKEHG